MEIQEILKNEEKWLRRCTRVLTSVKMIYINNPEEVAFVDLTDSKSKEITDRLLLRSKIGNVNKEINSVIVSRLNSMGLNVNEYISRFWSQINSGFASIDKRYDKANFNATFLSNKTSKLYRRFPDALTAKTMKDYLMYLREYVAFLRETGHKSAVERARAVASASGCTVDYAEKLLPKNWSEICKILKVLNNKASLTEDKHQYEDEEVE